jgi:hypothetical protein
MAKTKTEHVIIRNNNPFCSNCGQSQIVPYPIAIPVFVAIVSAFTKMHKNCQAIWKEPIVNMNLPEKLRANWWLKNSQRGLSSEAVFKVMMASEPQNIKGLSHPHDPSDFNRCYQLLQVIPEWKAKLHLLKPVSPQWSNLVDNWDKLTLMLEEQIETDKPNGMYELIQQLTTI